MANTAASVDVGERLLLGKAEAAGLLSISVSSINLMLRGGRLRGYRLGRRVLFKRSDVERLAEEIASPQKIGA